MCKRRSQIHNKGSMKARIWREVTCMRLAPLGLTSLLPFRFEHQYYDSQIMILRFNCLQARPRNISSLLPDFLVPALSSPHTSRPFSSTSRCRSRIGSAPLSLPQGVHLVILDPPAKRKKEITTIKPPKTVEIVGPLGTSDSEQNGEASDVRAGKMSLQLPPYMSLENDKETRKASLSILDREERKQREMWGTLTIDLPLRIIAAAL